MIHFLKWWWNDRLTLDGKYVVVIIGIFILSIISGFIFSLDFALAFLAVGFCLLLLQVLVRLSINYFRKEMQHYSEEQDRVVDTLKGKR